MSNGATEDVQCVRVIRGTVIDLRTIRNFSRETCSQLTQPTEIPAEAGEKDKQKVHSKFIHELKL